MEQFRKLLETRREVRQHRNCPRPTRDKIFFVTFREKLARIPNGYILIVKSLGHLRSTMFGYIRRRHTTFVQWDLNAVASYPPPTPIMEYVVNMKIFEHFEKRSVVEANSWNSILPRISLGESLGGWFYTWNRLVNWCNFSLTPSIIKSNVIYNYFNSSYLSKEIRVSKNRSVFTILEIVRVE